MAKHYSSADYRRLMESYEKKMKEARDEELLKMGNLVSDICGIDSPEEAERFLKAAVLNNRKHHWYSSASTDEVKEDVPDKEETPALGISGAFV